jgi:solute carrier family 25 protein 34/35
MHDRRAREQGPPPLWKRVIAGAVSGALGALACNPAELIKTRMQCYAGTASKGPVIGTQHHYNGLIDAFTSVVRNEGFLALYKGAGMSMLRSTLGSGSNLASYSWLRENLMQSGVLPDNWLTDATCSMLSSFITAIVMNPVDVIRTRVYNNSNAKACPTIITTKGGPMGLLLHVVRTEGVAALFKGWFASFIRLGPHFTLTFVFFEQFKRVAHHHQERVANKSHEKLLNELFTQYDANHDNELSTGELVTLLRDHIPRSTRLLRQEQFDGLIAHDVKHMYVLYITLLLLLLPIILTPSD